MGLAVLAGGLSFVGTADATELITDGSFENTTILPNKPLCRVGGTANPGVGGGWSTFSTYLYSANYTMPGPAGSGLQYLRPYPPNTYDVGPSSTNMTQLVSLTTTLTPAKIDSGLGQFTMSAWFCTYRTDNDNSELTLDFLDASNAPVGTPVVLGGFDFVSLLPEADNGRYLNAREWGQGSETGTIPVGARTARIVIQSHSLSGAPDGYVDLVSLDVVDAGVGTPTLASADPPDNAVSVGPVLNIGVTLRDRSTAVNTNSIQLFLDSNLVSPSIQKVETNTIVQYGAGLLPALSSHTYRIIFSDNGTPVTTQTNEFRFTVADYLTLPASLGSPLGSEDTTKPGFNVSVYQVDTLVQPDPPTVQQIDLPASIGFSEAVLAGLVGPNIADLTGAAAGNTFDVPGVINWITFIGATANFPNDAPFPGIPGTLGFEESFVHDVRTFVRFPASGFYRMGINNEDQFRLNAATVGIQTLQLVSPTNLVIPCVAIATNITGLQFGGSLPLTPLTATVVYATPSGNPDDACVIGTNTSLAGKIVLLDRGATNCDSAFKAEQAQMAGAVAVLQTTPGDTGYPFRLGDINTNVRIPVLVIAENYGAAQLKSYLTNGTPVTATIRGDPNPRVAEWDGPKGFGAVDVNVGFAVPTAGVYPLRLVTGQEAGNANLEWFSIKPDGTRILMNDTSNPDALRTFRARTVVQQPVFNAPTLAGGFITISWTGAGTLQEATSLGGSWSSSPSQNNPQTVPAASGNKFYRIQQ
ncbi:MAG TPA: PA domain-containing protein [Verrucomicrobiae bacterium]|nr:PA domain-containing protein [Verrucomicrobiae bacterium]